MNNKILTILTLGLLIFTSLNVSALDSNKNSDINICETNDAVSFTDLTIETKGEYIILNFNEANTYLNNPGKPMLPVCVKTYKFPIGTKIYDVEFFYSEVKKEAI